MDQLTKDAIAKLTREGRATKGYSQQDLANATGISLRSIQRIELGQVMPRPYTIRTLAEHLNFPKDETKSGVVEAGSTKKIILSVGIALVIIFSVFAFLSQSVTFPETEFEIFTLISIVMAGYVIVLWRIWR